MTKKRYFAIFSFMIVVFFLISNVCDAESVIDKIKKTGKLTVGAREGAPPFGYYDEKGNWVGWSMDLSRALARVIGEKLGIKLDLEFKPINPNTRIPLIVNRTLDWVLGSTGRNVSREGVIDFSFLNNAVCVMLLVPNDSPVKSYADLAGKRVGVTKGSVEERVLTEMGKKGEINPPPILVTFSKHSLGFLGMRQGKTDAHCTMDVVLHSLRLKAPNPENWEVRGPTLFCIPNGILLPENDSDWRDMVNDALCHLIRVSGEYFEIYDDWFGLNNPKAGFHRPLPENIKITMNEQCPFGIENWLSR